MKLENQVQAWVMVSYLTKQNFGKRYLNIVKHEKNYMISSKTGLK